MKRIQYFAIFYFLSLAWLSSLDPAWADAKTHLAAAENLAKVLEVETAIAEMRVRVFEPRLQQNVELKDYQLAIEPFFQRFMSYQALKGRILNLFVSNFSEEELSQAALFFGSPAGRKLTKKLPEVMGQINNIAFHEGEKQIDVLKSMIEEEKKAVAPDL